MSKLKNSVRNNSVSTLLPPRVPDLPGENGGPHPHAKPPSSSILNTVNKSTNKVSSELTTLTETTEKPPPPPLTITAKPRLLANGPRGWGRLKAKTGANPEKESCSGSPGTQDQPQPDQPAAGHKQKPGVQTSSSSQDSVSREVNFYTFTWK